MSVIRKAALQAFGRAESIAVAMAKADVVAKRRKPISAFHGQILGHGAHQYELDAHWCRADPATHPVKNCHELAQTSDGRIFLLTDHPKNNIIVFDDSGNFVTSWTLGYSGAHGLTLAGAAGEERLWITDTRSESVVETTLDGKVLRRLPTPHTSGAYRPAELYIPTETAVAPDGSIYVADGYGTQRVLQFDPDGKFIRYFGGKKDLDCAHGIVVDCRSSEGQSTLLVTSRSANCLVRYSMNGDLLETIEVPGAYICRPVIAGENIYMAVCWSGRFLNPNSGFAVILDMQGNLISAPGATLGSDGTATTDHVFRHCHDVLPLPSGDLIVCQWNADRVLPVRLKKI